MESEKKKKKWSEEPRRKMGSEEGKGMISRQKKIDVLFFFPLRFHIYVLAYGICFSLSDLLHSV